MTLRTALLALALGSACAESPEPSEPATDGRTPSVDGAWNEVAAELPDETGDICGLLPAAGVCSHACDPDAVASYVPAGVCVAFRCTLTDGRVITISACNQR